MPIFNPPACDIGVTFVLMPLLLKWQGIGTIFLGNVYELLEPGKKYPKQMERRLTVRNIAAGVGMPLNRRLAMRQDHLRMA